ncbi:MAG: hypothetical protein WEB57_06845 [Pseudohongiellaceae bacterium]
MIFSLLKRRGKGARLRMAIGGTVLTLAALYALAVAYDIPMREMSVYLLGSLALLLGTALGAIVVVIAFKLLKRVLSVLFGPVIRRLVAVDDTDRDD